MTTSHRFTKISWGLHCAGLSITVLGIGLVAIFVFYPLQSEKNACAKKVIEQQKFLDSTEIINSKNRELNNALKEMQGKLSMFIEKIPDSPNEAVFLASLTKLSKETKLEIQDYRPSLAIDRKTHKEMEISISAKGTYAGICRFIHGLSEIPRSCHIANLDIIASEDPEMLQEVEMTLGIYFAPVRKQNKVEKN